MAQINKNQQQKKEVWDSVKLQVVLGFIDYRTTLLTLSPWDISFKLNSTFFLVEVHLLIYLPLKDLINDL